MNNNVIFVDNSILSTGVCEEKQRLAYIEHLAPKKELPPLVFGSIFHAAVATYYTRLSAGAQFGEALHDARSTFISEAREHASGVLPLSADSDEKRSVERGLNILDAYSRKWRKFDVNWKDVIDPSKNEPYVEIGFSIYFMDWCGIPVVFVGKVDRVRVNRVDGQLYGIETKTTGSGVKRYVEQVRPNHQLTGYKWALHELIGLDIAGMILDIVHVSDRKVGGKFPDGVDEENDFGRIETRRSRIDVDEFLFDLKRATTKFLTMRDEVTEGKIKRAHRQAPAACFMYGGCHFRKACASNLNPQIMKNEYIVKPWHPWIDTPKRVLTNIKT